MLGWDNSNSQYGVLGTWAAAEAGITVGASYWADVQRHWEEHQNRNGSWSYRTGDPEGSLSMTSAGIPLVMSV